MYGSGFYGSLVIAAGLVVTSQTPVPPSTDGNGYGSAAYGQGVYGSGLVVTSQTPVPPVADGNGYACVYYGAGVYGAGLVVTSQIPIPPPGPPVPVVTVRKGTNDANSYPVATNLEIDFDNEEEEEIMAIVSLWLNLK